MQSLSSLSVPWQELHVNGTSWHFERPRSVGVYTRNSLKNQVHQLFEKQIQTRKFLTSRAADRENIKVGIKMYSLKYALTVGQMDQSIKCLLHKYRWTDFRFPAPRSKPVQCLMVVRKREIGTSLSSCLNSQPVSLAWRIWCSLKNPVTNYGRER